MPPAYGNEVYMYKGYTFKKKTNKASAVNDGYSFEEV